MGLVHSIVIDKLDQIAGDHQFINSSHGFFKSTNHFSCIEKIPISEVAQNLFFNALSILKLSYLSHSKYNTVSTICSKVLGHARFQSLVMCHIINIATLVAFA
jgi:enoyl-[acyl-carrier-protein] reductase (NADH)